MAGHGPDRFIGFKQQAALAQALGEFDADIAIRMLQDQAAKQRIRLRVRADVAQQLGTRKQARGVLRRLGQMAVDQGQGLVDMPFLDEASRAVANDQKIVRPFFQERGPLLGHALVQARRLLQSKEQKTHFGVFQVIARQRLGARQVFLGDLNPHRRRNDLLQLGVHPLKVGHYASPLGCQRRVHAAFLRLAFSIHARQRSM
ncbi:hypothetical protein D3C71_1377270 [compost metagenome]